MRQGRSKYNWEPKGNAFTNKLILKEFLKKYGDKYPENTKEKLDEFLIEYLGNYMNLMECFQIYDYLDLFNDEDNIYYGYYKKLSETFDIDCNILDVASGFIPSFGTIVAGKQLELPNAKGKITVCDPAMIIDNAKYSNMTINKNKFSSDIDLSKYDLITGIMPCAVTRDLITAACQQNKDFYIGLCGCVPDNYEYDDAETYLEKNLEFARKMCREYGRGDLQETQLDENFVVKFPVIYSKKR